MEIRIGVAKKPKFGTPQTGEQYAIVERASGGLAILLADGQAGGGIEREVADCVLHKAKDCLAAGSSEERAVEQVHDALYDMQGRRRMSAFAILSLDTAEEMLSIQRNGAMDVLLKTEDYEATYDEEFPLLGAQRHVKSDSVTLPIEERMLAVLYSDGVKHAGKKYDGHDLDAQQIFKILQHNTAEDVSFIAQNILETAIRADREAAGDDMTVIVVGIVKPKEERFYQASMEMAFSYGEASKNE